MRKESCRFLLLLMAVLAHGGIQAQSIDLDAWQAASPTHPYDITFLLQNPQGTQNSGWNRNPADAAAGYNKHNKEFASDVYDGTGIESWYWKPVTNDELIWQDITGLAAGTYRITAYAVGQIYHNTSRKGECGTGSYLFAGNNQTAITANTWQALTVTTDLKKDEVLRIGIRTDATNENEWVSIAQVKVECIAFTGMSTLTSMTLDEKLDVSVARQSQLADIRLYRTLSASHYTPLYIPFDLNETQCRTYFNEVLQVTDARTDGQGVLRLQTAKSATIAAGTPYLVKGKQSGRTCIQVCPAVISAPTPDALVLPGGLRLTGSYRQQEGLEAVYLPATDGTSAVPALEPGKIKGYNFYITTK